ncbi:MAG: prolyl oligopeptidase family serine peptidase [Planctomycetota bacterium]|nr:prolyl oligopeptidase family serine peptidase [Planctomycetota bacterium]
MTKRFAVCLPLLLILLPLSTPAGAEEAKPPVAPKRLETADYAKWERLGMWGLSPDGKWVAWQVRRMDGDVTLHAATTEGKQRKTFEHGSAPSFSKDGRFLAFRIGVSEKEKAKLAKAKKPAPAKIGVHDLSKDKTEEIEGVQSFTFSDDGAYLLMRRSKPKGQKHAGATVLVRDLAKGTDTSFGNVASAQWMDDRSLLALVIDAADKLGNGVQLFDAASGRLRTLDSSKHTYSRLTWREDAADLAVLLEHEHGKDEDTCFVVKTWRGVDTDTPKSNVYDHREDDTFAEDMRVVDLGGLTWSEDGKAVFFGIKDWENKPKAKKAAAKGKKQNATAHGHDHGKNPKEKPAASDGEKPKTAAEPAAKADEGAAAEKPAKEATKKQKPAKKDKAKQKPKSLRETLDEPAGVEVWHAKDIEVQPRQKKTYARKKNENYLCAWWLDSGKLVRIGDGVVEQVRTVKPHTIAVGLDNTPYEEVKRFGPALHDVYVIDTRTGARDKILERTKYVYGTSPDARYVLYQKGTDLFTYDRQTKAHANLTGGIDARFINDERRTATEEPPAYGTAGWTEDGAYVFLYDEFDIWQVKSDGSDARRVTQGAETQVRYRREVLDRDEDEFIRADRPMWLSMSGRWSKKTGYARVAVLGEGKVTPAQLLWVDKSVGRLVRAKDAEVFAYVEQTFADAPDLIVSDAELSARTQVSDLNAFQKDYAWSPRSVLVDYKSTHGERLQGALHYPAGYEAGQTYPMIVDIYERRSGGLHRYAAPSERHAYNAGVWTTQGYFVFQPDIVYRDRNPGLSALECIVPAVEAVLTKGDVDRKRIGLVGHSWGAYQTAFIVTQTDLFAAGVAGAPLTNMISMSMGNYWNSGRTNAWIFHEGQGRMDMPFWRDVETYIKNSPIFHIDKMNTPLLIAFGDKDGAVDWQQGVEMYNAARLAQRPLVMLVYPGENHGLRQKPNQVDYHHRVREWFDHHLKGTKAEPWITKGKSHFDRQKELDKRKKKASGRKKRG